MLRLLLRRLAQTVPIVAAVALIVFVLFSVIPGNILGAGDDGRQLDPAVAARLTKELQLDQPLAARFAGYLSRLAVGDLGQSFRTREPVTTMISGRLWPSLKLTLAAMAFAMAIGVPLGFLAALRQGGTLDALSMVAAVSGLSLPAFWLGLLLMYVVAVKLQWLPTFGYGNGGMAHLVLPAITLGFGYAALLARTTRAAVLDVLDADFIRTACAKGLSQNRIMIWHVGRNTLVLILTTLGLQFGTMMGQAVVVEKLFSWPGLGSLLVDSVFQRDIPVIQGCILVIVLFFLLVNTLTDIAYSLVDPRIRYS